MGELTWRAERRPVWDAAKTRVVGGAPTGVFDFSYADGDPLPGDWWAALSDDDVVGYGWMEIGWDGAEILLAVDPDARGRGVGSFVIDRLEQEAAARGVNYVYNAVAPTHPDRDTMHDWLGVRGYRGDDTDRLLRKRVDPPSPATSGTPDPLRVTREASAAMGPGREESGGYVDVDDHRY